LLEEPKTAQLVNFINV